MAHFVPLTLDEWNRWFVAKAWEWTVGRAHGDCSARCWRPAHPLQNECLQATGKTCQEALVNLAAKVREGQL